VTENVLEGDPARRAVGQVLSELYASANQTEMYVKFTISAPARRRARWYIDGIASFRLNDFGNSGWLVWNAGCTCPVWIRPSPRRVAS